MFNDCSPVGSNPVRRHRDPDRRSHSPSGHHQPLDCTSLTMRDSLICQFSNLGLDKTPQKLFKELKQIADNDQGAARQHFQ